jgi:hypothetical protein
LAAVSRLSAIGATGNRRRRSIGTRALRHPGQGPLERQADPPLHTEGRICTVISGVFYIGLGNAFDEERLQPYPPGGVVVLPGGMPHFHWAKSGTYVTQVSAVGPLGLEYLDPTDDPRNQ